MNPDRAGDDHRAGRRINSPSIGRPLKPHPIAGWRSRVRRPALSLAALLVAALSGSAAEVPSPESHLGFRPGADGHLARWEQVVQYFQAVDAASPRVAVETLGPSTEGRPLIMAVIGREEVVADLDRYRGYQRVLSHPPEEGASVDEAVESAPAVVLITCSIHSSETASTHMAMELLHELAIGEDPATREILAGTIVLLVPSVNPDGVDIVADWYERSRGKPWEGNGLPRLYHKYAGHDTNRDWFMLNLQETRLLSRMLYREWFPTLSYDVHEMGMEGARMFVPPFHDPINPNLDPRLNQSLAVIGAHMAADLARAGKRGVLTHAMYDNWWNGGNRTTPQRHNIVGVLTESARVRLATPVFIPRSELKANARGFDRQDPAVNFVDPWPGGWWRLRDILEYQEICARSLLTLASRYRRDFQRQYAAMSREAVRRGRTEPPFAWVVPSDNTDLPRAARLVRTLHDTGIQVHQTTEPLDIAGTSIPAGSWILPAAQPYRPHLKDMMERQDYPARFTRTGAAEPPYDVAGWTLPLQMGVRAQTIDQPIPLPGQPLETIPEPTAPNRPPLDPEADLLVLPPVCNQDVRVAFQLAENPDARFLAEPVQHAGRSWPAGSLVLPATAEVRERLSPGQPLAPQGELFAIRGNLPGGAAVRRVHRPRVGLYQPWVPSMDEGWTRLVLETHGIAYTTQHDAEIRAGALRDRFDAIVIPSIKERTLRSGWAAEETEPAYVGGLGAEGSQTLRDFARAGGTVVCLEDSCRYAIEEWGLPVREVLASKPASEFYCPGSIVRVAVEPATGPISRWLTSGMPEEFSAFFDRSLAFRAEKDEAQVVVRYARGNPLESGWLLGPGHLAGEAAVVDVAFGGGRVVLFGFPPQHRGQTHGTFRLLFNALLRAGMESG